MPRHPGVGKLKDRVALITGGDSGIGRAVAVLFAREGAKVAIAYYEETKDAEKTKELVEAEVKWSQKIGQSAKVYPKLLKGYENGKAPELYRSV